MTHSATTRPRPADWGRHRSLVHQVCLDIAPVAYDVECASGRNLTGG